MTKNEELTEYDLLDAERLIVEYAHEGNGICREVELENFEVVRIEECMTTIEIQALKELMKNDDNFDLEFDKFYSEYVKLSADIKTNQVLKKGNELKLDFARIFGDIRKALDEIERVCNEK